MLETMARAAYEAMRDTLNALDLDVSPWEDENEGLREDWRAAVRAALESARNPTPPVLRAGFYRGAGDGWAAMIDAILKEAAP
jgi:hypothetical protein